MQNRFDNLTVKVVFKDILTRDKNELSANTLSWRCTPWVGHQIRKMDVSNSLWKRSITSSCIKYLDTEQIWQFKARSCKVQCSTADKTKMLA